MTISPNSIEQLRKDRSVFVEMSEDDLLALHSTLNALEALDEIFGEVLERTRTIQQLKDLRARFKESQAAAREEHSVKV